MIIVYSLVAICVLIIAYIIIDILLHKNTKFKDSNRQERAIECARAVEEVIFNNHSKSISRSISDAEQVLKRHNLEFSYLNITDKEIK